MMDISKVGIIVKQGSAEAAQIAGELREWFVRQAVVVQIDAISPDMDLLVILGGDGTLLHVADQASRYGVPVVGVNLGGLGFLTEVAVAGRYEAFAAIMAGAVLVEDRMMLQARLHSERGVTPWQLALNDVVISKGNVDRLVRIITWADDEYITTYKADGLIVSTPTGSTAYNLSAGGPLVFPGLDAILVTPICPFMLESRPLLLPPQVTICAKLDGRVNDVKLIIDGRFSWDVGENDLLEIRVADQPLRLIIFPRKRYFEILRNKLNWGGRIPVPSPPGK